MASQSPHSWKKSDDGKTIELDANISDGLIVPCLTFSASAVGAKAIGSAQSVSATATYVPLQIYLSVAADTVDKTIGAAYFKVVTAAAMSGQIATVMVRTTVSHDVFDAYGLQSHLVFGASADVSTTDANAHLTALSAKVTFDTSTVTKGWVNAGLFIVEGGGTCSQMCYGVSIVVEAASTGCQGLLHLNADAAVADGITVVGGTNLTYLVNVDGATGAAVVAAGQPAGHAAAGYLSIKVGDTAYAVPFWAVTDMANS